jgi:hypothetical protein
VRESQVPERGRQLLLDVLPDPLGELLESSAIESARQKLTALPSLPQRPRLHGRDWVGAGGVCLLVFLSTFPVVLPFLFFSPVHRAMRISNGVAIVMLYAAGHGSAATRVCDPCARDS